MTRRKIGNKNIRKIFKNGSSYAITIPLEIVKELKWRKSQKVVIKKTKQGFLVNDWKE